MDSGMSADSTQSDIVERKKKKGLLGKLKKLTKSRSIEDRNGSQEDFFMKVGFHFMYKLGLNNTILEPAPNIPSQKIGFLCSVKSPVENKIRT